VPYAERPLITFDGYKEEFNNNWYGRPLVEAGITGLTAAITVPVAAGVAAGAGVRGAIGALAY
jgi:hypothetical protein